MYLPPFIKKNHHLYIHSKKLVGDNIKLFSILAFIFIICFFSSSSYSEEIRDNQKINVVFFSPDKKGNVYWDFVTSTMRHAAEDLAINLQVVYANKSNFHNEETFTSLMSTIGKPDYLLYIYQKNRGLKLLKFAEINNINSFILNTIVTLDDRKVVGTPKQKFTQWVGHIYPQLDKAGENIACTLFQQAEAKNLIAKDGSIHAIAVSGSRDSSSAVEWSKGIEKSASLTPHRKIQQIVYSNWNAERAYNQVKGLLGRYPEVAVVLTIDESTSLAAIRAIEDSGKQANIDVLVGGVVISSNGIEAIKGEKLTANYGQSIWSGVYGLVYVFDHFHGLKLLPEEYEYSYVEKVILTKELKSFDMLMSDNAWKNINFKRFSRYLNPKIKNYDFSPEAMVNILQK